MTTTEARDELARLRPDLTWMVEKKASYFAFSGMKARSEVVYSVSCIPGAAGERATIFNGATMEECFAKARHTLIPPVVPPATANDE